MLHVIISILILQTKYGLVFKSGLLPTVPILKFQVKTCFGLCLTSSLNCSLLRPLLEIASACQSKTTTYGFFKHLFHKKKTSAHFFQYLKTNKKNLLRGWPHTKILFREKQKIIKLWGSEKHDHDSNAPSLTLVLHGEQTCLKCCWEGLTCSVDVHQLGQKQERLFCQLHTLNLWSASWYLNVHSALIDAFKYKRNRNPLYHTYIASRTLKSTKMTAL